MVAEVAEGFAEVRRRPWVGLVIVSASLGLMIAFSPFSALGPSIAREVYGDAAVFGVITAVWGAGAIIGSALALRWRPRRPVFAGMIAVLPWTVNYIAFSAGLPLWGLVPFSLASGIGVALFSVWWETAMASNIPPSALSRVSAFDWMGSLGLSPIGFLLAGPIAAEIGARETLAAGAAIALMVDLAVMTAPAVRRVRQPNSGTPVSEVEASA
jgi:MFS family permease